MSKQIFDESIFYHNSALSQEVDWLLLIGHFCHIYQIEDLTLSYFTKRYTSCWLLSDIRIQYIYIILEILIQIESKGFTLETFNFKTSYQKLLTPEIIFSLTQLHEYKGRLNRLLETDSAALAEIQETAILQNVAASNTMEGITVADERLKKLILNKTNPQTDDEKKVAGYRDVLASISANYDYLPPVPPTNLQIHRELYKFSGKTTGGNY